MNWIILGLIALVGLFFLNNLKHHLVRKLITLFLVMGVILMILLFTSSYFDMGKVFNKENVFAKTGAAVVNTVSTNVDTPSAKSIFSGVSSSVMNFTDSTFTSLETGGSDFLKLNN